MDEFRVLLLKLSSEITTEELRGLKFALRDVIPSGVMERLHRATDVFAELENMGYLSSSNRELLADILDKIGREDLRNKALGITGSVGPVQATRPQVQLIMPTSIIQESQINNIAEEISVDWKVLGRELRIREAHLDNIAQDYRQTREKAFQVVLKWRQMNGNNATVDKLMQALIKIGRRDIAENLSEPRPRGGQTPAEGVDRVDAFDMSPLDPRRYMPPVRTPTETHESPNSFGGGPVVVPTDQKTWTRPQREYRRNHNFTDSAAEERPENTSPRMATPTDQHTWTMRDGGNHNFTDSAAEERPENTPGVEERVPQQVEPLPPMVKLGNYLNPDKYEPIKLLGAGSFGKVYLVRRKGQIYQGTYVAVKQVDLGTNDKGTQESVKALKLEMELMKNFDHENILRVLYLEEGHNTLNLFMEFMPGGSLSHWVQDNDLPESRIKSYTKQILEGLRYLHSRGIIHRDIKGENILITEDVEKIKLADFGISQKMEVLQKATRTGFKATKSGLGAVYWKCPEILNDQDFKENCDIWSLGCTVIEMLTKLPPYGDLGPCPAMLKIVQNDVKAPQGCSADLVEFLSLCFIKDISRRPGAAELLRHKYVLE